MWKIFAVTSQGQRDYSQGRNNQDHVDSYVAENMAVSFICDGCHGGAHSEVIAQLSAPFLVRTTRKLLESGVALDNLPDKLFEEYLNYLQWNIDVQFFRTSEEVEGYIRAYLMCTAIGIVLYKNRILLLSCGDGSFYLNNSVFKVIRSPNNMASYPAYNMYKRFGFLGKEVKEIVDSEGRRVTIPVGFEVQELGVENVDVVGVASDGLNGLPKLFDELRLYATSQKSLRFCMNRIATVRGETVDNATVAFLVKGG
ncbi:MAG: protein phosphatase 2C domain-containing protein [Patescibacteria group bacterium]